MKRLINKYEIDSIDKQNRIKSRVYAKWGSILTDMENIGADILSEYEDSLNSGEMSIGEYKEGVPSVWTDIHFELYTEYADYRMELYLNIYNVDRDIDRKIGKEVEKYLKSKNVPMIFKFLIQDENEYGSNWHTGAFPIDAYGKIRQ